MRNLVWFSCGSASFACLWMLKDLPDLTVAYCDTGSEHPDNERFMLDAELACKVNVNVLKNNKYKDHFDVCRKERYLNGVNGARCTVELKKVLRFKYQQPDDIQVFGYTIDEKHRADRLVKAYPEINARFPLIEKGWNKQDCINLLHRLGIEIPVMYRLGYGNNNCIGCVKGGAGYWNKIRKDFPHKFNEMAQIEREVGHSCIKGKFLDELPVDVGVEPKGYEMSCDFICQSMEFV
jgi:3'-phosphoadenosine 5'-phosphosulfate sulfotransferase (PAPS reductase)/FAD synthetase